jgi:hypothetical protein
MGGVTRTVVVVGRFRPDVMVIDVHVLRNAFTGTVRTLLDRFLLQRNRSARPLTSRSISRLRLALTATRQNPRLM